MGYVHQFGFDLPGGLVVVRCTTTNSSPFSCRQKASRPEIRHGPAEYSTKYIATQDGLPPATLPSSFVRTPPVAATTELLAGQHGASRQLPHFQHRHPPSNRGHLPRVSSSARGEPWTWGICPLSRRLTAQAPIFWRAGRCANTDAGRALAASAAISCIRRGASPWT